MKTVFGEPSRIPVYAFYHASGMLSGRFTYIRPSFGKYETYEDIYDYYKDMLINLHNYGHTPEDPHEKCSYCKQAGWVDK